MHETTKRLRFALARRHDETTIRRKKNLVLVVSSFRRLVVEPEGSREAAVLCWVIGAAAS